MTCLWARVRREARYLFRDIAQGSGEDLVGARLAPKRLSHQHEAMTHAHHFINLQDLLCKEICHLQVHLLACFFDGIQQDVVVWFGEFYPRKKV